MILDGFGWFNSKNNRRNERACLLWNVGEGFRAIYV